MKIEQVLVGMELAIRRTNQRIIVSGKIDFDGIIYFHYKKDGSAGMEYIENIQQTKEGRWQYFKYLLTYGYPPDHRIE